MTETQDHHHDDDESGGSFVIEIVKFAIIALLVIYPVRAYVAQPYIVLGESMEPTFHEREYLIVDRLSYRFDEPERGAVIIFNFPLSEKSPPERFIKRIIGLPGETIEFKNGKLFITTSGGGRFQFVESYLEFTTSGDSMARKLGPNEYFVAGDNRPESSDSRIWGPITRDDIVGRVYLRLFPFGRVGYLPGDLRTNQSRTAN
ncbi:MAG: signal peptidase I [Candidatus Vogelbacteria bacterium]|nr:signal peptidase I [Candidatus Vogelbacteria bacterium]